jgi:DNA-binding GntR family transcriptional regulator
MQARTGADIYAELLSAIEEGALRPGTRLREAELAREFGVSRTPVREALKRLEAQGLAVHKPNRGMVIPVLGHDEINELYTVRQVLEGAVARFAAQHASDAEIGILRDMIAVDRRHIDDAEALARFNREFHRRLTLASHNRYLIEQVAHLRQAILLLHGTTLVDPARRRSAIEEHARIVEAIAARDGAAAEEAARHHIGQAHAARLKSV